MKPVAIQFALTLLATLTGLGAAPEVVKVGPKGSVASAPPSETDAGRKGDTVAATLTMELFAESSAIEGRALPSNQWWTRLLVDRFGGMLWAYPLAVEAKAEAVTVHFPKEWNSDGRTMLKGRGLKIHGLARSGATEVPDGGPLIVADFEDKAYPDGWTTDGGAMGAQPAPGLLPGQTPMGGYAGKGLVNSFLPGDGGVGTLRSAEFTLERDYLHFLIGGGEDMENLCVRLLVGDEPVLTTTGRNSEQLHPMVWDIRPWRGKSGVLEVLDSATGGWGHILADHFVLDDKPAAAPPSRFVRAEASRVLAWGDWTLSFRHAAETGEGFDVTLGRGMPLAWFEARGLRPVLAVPNDATLTDGKGGELGIGAITASFTAEIDGACFGVHLPPGTKVTPSDGGLALDLPEKAQFFSVSALPEAASMPLLAEAAFSVPRGSRVDWNYDPARGTVTTRWRLAADPLAGGEPAVVQGWLPHHLRGTRQQIDFNGLEYATPRGLLRCAAKADTTIHFPFEGLLPMLPPPPAQATGEFDPSRLADLVTSYAGMLKFGEDTYWGGKDLLRCAQVAVLAHQTAHPAAGELRDKLAAALDDWFNWTPNEASRFFTWYPRWGGLVGFKDSYGSFRFTDLHFHNGYFTTSSALLASLDPGFLSDYGEMARLVAKAYANWERDDQRFPAFRTFDFWEGHSWAGGFSSPGGNNQESSSEAIQSWAGLFLLGAALGDEAMQAAGAMGYAMERASTLDYWLDQPGFTDGPDASSMPPSYDQSVTGILFADGGAYATYFSGDPAWIHGIQWFPLSPWLDHLAADRPFSRHLFDSMMSERAAWFEREAQKHPNKKHQDPASIDGMGNALGNVALGFLALADPTRALAESAALAEAGSAVAVDPEHILPLAHAASRQSLGPRLWNCRTTLPTSACFGTPDGFLAVLHNPASKQVTATIFANGKTVGTVEVPPRQLLVHRIGAGK